MCRLPERQYQKANVIRIAAYNRLLTVFIPRRRLCVASTLYIALDIRVKQGVYTSMFTTAPVSSPDARSPKRICNRYCTAKPMKAKNSIQRERS